MFMGYACRWSIIASCLTLHYRMLTYPTLIMIIIYHSHLNWWRFSFLFSDIASRNRSETNSSSRSSSSSSSRPATEGEGLSQRMRTRQPIISINLPQSELGNEVAERVKDAGKEGWAQTKIAGMWGQTTCSHINCLPVCSSTLSVSASALCPTHTVMSYSIPQTFSPSLPSITGIISQRGDKRSAWSRKSVWNANPWCLLQILLHGIRHFSDPYGRDHRSSNVAHQWYDGDQSCTQPPWRLVLLTVLSIYSTFVLCLSLFVLANRSHCHQCHLSFYLSSTCLLFSYLLSYPSSWLFTDEDFFALFNLFTSIHMFYRLHSSSFSQSFCFSFSLSSCSHLGECRHSKESGHHAYVHH